MLVYLLGVGV